MKKSNGFALMRRTWKFFLGRNPVHLVRSLFGLFRDRPITIFVTILCLRHMSWLSLAVILVVFVFNQILNELFVNKRLVLGKLRVIYGFLNIYENSRPAATRYLVSDYLPKETYQDIDHFFLQLFLGLFGISNASIDDSVWVYRVKAEGAVGANLVCYAGFRHSYIFFNESPSKKMGAFQRFTFLHELAHACTLYLKEGVFFSAHFRKVYLIYFVFLAYLLDWRMVPWWALAGVGLAVLMSLIEKIIISSRNKLNYEIVADGFALSYMEADERVQLSSLLKAYTPLFIDSQMTAKENAYRLKNLEEGILLAKENREDDLLDKMFALHADPKILTLITTCVLAALPAFYSKAPDWRLLLTLGLATVLLLVLFVFFHMLLSGLHSIISSRLGKWEAS